MASRSSSLTLRVLYVGQSNGNTFHDFLRLRHFHVHVRGGQLRARRFVLQKKGEGQLVAAEAMHTFS